jgi:ketosteroid isomerase-like protein
MATGEIRLSILWEWLHKGARLTDGDVATGARAGQVFDAALFGRLLDEEYAKLLAARDRDAIRRTIADQIEALRRDDGAAAFAFAAPAIQDLFGTPENFMRMVRSAYAPLYRPRDVRFAELEIVAGEVTQKVVVVDAEGRPATALYLMDRQPDGAWKILGCVIVPREEMTA